MEVKCIKFKFENTTYIIKDLEIDSRSLNTKSIVAKLFTEDYILNEIAPNGTLRVINSDILKNKISQFGKTDFKDVISVIEDDSVLYVREIPTRYYPIDVGEPTKMVITIYKVLR